MNILENIASRYTTKQYDASKKVSKESVDILKQILHKSPSSINSQPWKFIIIEDENKKNELAAASYFNQQKIEEASHLIVFTAVDDISLFEQHVHHNLPSGAATYYTTFIKTKPVEDIKVWLQHQVYLSLGMLLSACANLGIDSTPMEGIEHDKYANILQLKSYTPLFAVAIGYRNQEDKNQPHITPKSRLPISNVIEEI
ncbi:nitroreductase family protein [Zhouia sp. PK063]|uniref:nitroreductase family protein n=1 Tax=Zhouia sp. PK063 TaxID=3373602 RepID=UPI0037966363